jgi:hypothetical protein
MVLRAYQRCRTGDRRRRLRDPLFNNDAETFSAIRRSCDGWRHESEGGAMHRVFAGIATVAALIVFAGPVPSLAADLDNFEERGYLDYPRPMVPETFIVTPGPRDRCR